MLKHLKWYVSDTPSAVSDLSGLLLHTSHQVRQCSWHLVN